jgi:hypothetical protein
MQPGMQFEKGKYRLKSMGRPASSAQDDVIGVPKNRWYIGAALFFRARPASPYPAGPTYDITSATSFLFKSNRCFAGDSWFKFTSTANVLRSHGSSQSR